MARMRGTRFIRRRGYGRVGASLAGATMGYIGGGVRGAAFGARAGYQLSSSLRNRRRFNGKPLTNQRDMGTMYRRKRMPYRRRKRWISFKRKVQAVTQQMTGKLQNIILRGGNVTSLANKQTGYGGHCVMGLNGDGDTNDVSYLFDRANTFLGGGFLKTAMKIQVTGWMCETQIQNESAAETSSPSGVWCDLYYWRCKRRISSITDSFLGVWTEALGDLSSTVPIGGSILDWNDYGITPFQGGLAKGITIWKKVRTYLPPGGVTQIETRSGKNYSRVWGTDEEYSMDTCTEGVFMIFYGTPSTTNATADPVNVRLSTNKNYTWRIIQNNINAGGTSQA